MPDLPLTTNSTFVVANFGTTVFGEVAVQVYIPRSLSPVLEICSVDKTLVSPVVEFNWGWPPVILYRPPAAIGVDPLLHVNVGAGRAVPVHVRSFGFVSFTKSIALVAVIVGLTGKRNRIHKISSNNLSERDSALKPPDTLTANTCGCQQQWQNGSYMTSIFILTELPSNRTAGMACGWPCHTLYLLFVLRATKLFFEWILRVSKHGMAALVVSMKTWDGWLCEVNLRDSCLNFLVNEVRPN